MVKNYLKLWFFFHSKPVTAKKRHDHIKCKWGTASSHNEIVIILSTQRLYRGQDTLKNNHVYLAFSSAFLSSLFYPAQKAYHSISWKFSH